MLAAMHELRMFYVIDRIRQCGGNNYRIFRTPFPGLIQSAKRSAFAKTDGENRIFLPLSIAAPRGEKRTQVPCARINQMAEIEGEL